MFNPFRRKPLTPYEAALRRLARGDAGGAESALTQLLQSAPGARVAAQIANKRGVARIALGRTDEARADFEAALDQWPDFPPALVNIANLQLEAGNVEAAIALYERAVRVDDGYALAHSNLSVALKRAGRHDEAVRAYRRAGRLEGRLFGKPRTPRGY